MSLSRRQKVMKPIRVMIADKEPTGREGLRSVLKREQDIEVVGESSHGVETLELVEKLKPDILILDPAMPEMNGVKEFSLFMEKSPWTKVLVFTSHVDEEIIFHTIQAGVVGCLPKTAATSVLVKAVRAVSAGEIWAGRKLLSKLLRASLNVRLEKEALEEAPFQNLTKREVEVIGLIAEGCSNKDIANRLSISEQTVKAHLNSIFKKLKLKSRFQLVLRVLRGKS